jgi:hypothetical protein
MKGVAPVPRRLVHPSPFVTVLVGLSIVGCSGTQSTSPVPASPSFAVAPSAPASPPATPSSAPSTSTEPPTASLTVEGGDPVVGQLGSYTWAGGGSDSPWLPGTKLDVGAGERVTLSLDPDIAVAEWTASRVDAGTTDGSGAVGLGSGTGVVSFTAPEAETGAWSIQVALRFADDRGSAAYYWALDMP